MKKFFGKIKSLFWGDDPLKGGSAIFIVVTVLSVIALVTSNVIAGKSFSVFGWHIGGADVVLTCGVLIFPISYICSDLLSECWGFSASRRVTWISFACNLIFDVFIILSLLIPGANPYYQNVVSDGLMNGLGMDFLQGGASLGSLGILAASLTAFIFGSWIDDLVFEVFRKRHKNNDSNGKFVLRAVGSSLAGEIVDSIIFIPLLYLFTNQMGVTITSFWQVVAIVGIQAGIKTLYELLVSPLTCFLAKKIKKYEAEHGHLPLTEENK